jgi:hypothetical protein
MKEAKMCPNSWLGKRGGDKFHQPSLLVEITKRIFWIRSKEAGKGGKGLSSR